MALSGSFTTSSEEGGDSNIEGRIDIPIVSSVLFDYGGLSVCLGVSSFYLIN
jgi:hypothetical protein